MTIRELRLLPPLVIARVGSSPEPLDNYRLEDDPANPLAFRRIIPAETLIVDSKTGEASTCTPQSIAFRDADGLVRPVAPFLEVVAVMDSGTERPLDDALLRQLGQDARVEWRVTVANRKVQRRTGDERDAVVAETGSFSNHDEQPLKGKSRNFVSDDAFIDFGRVRYLKPNDACPGVRLRFTPATGLIYGPRPDPAPDTATRKATGETEEEDQGLFAVPEDRAIYDPNKGKWPEFHSYLGLVEETARYKGDDADRKKIAAEIRRRLEGRRPSTELPEKLADEVERILDGRASEEEIRFRRERLSRETLPPSLYAMHPPAPAWLNDDIAFSRGYLDDTCDGIVEVRIAGTSRQDQLTAVARICSGPPMVVPDTLFIRNLSDDLDQAIYGPDVPADEKPEQTRERALDVVRRAFETVRFLNVAVANGNPVMGRDGLDFDTMPAEEAFQTQRQMRPVFPEHTADTLAVEALHQHVYAALQAGTAPWFPRLLRRPNHVGDYTDHGRRQMPALMCGADGSYLALTYRQIDAIFEAAAPPRRKVEPRNETAARRHRHLHHRAAGNPISTTPTSAVANCTPGLEVDLRAVWRRVFEGIELREYDNLVVTMEDGFAARGLPDLTGHRLLGVEVPDPRPGGNEKPKILRTMTEMIGPSPADPDTRTTLLTTRDNPNGVAPLEWSNALAKVLKEYSQKAIWCLFTPQPVWEVPQPLTENRLRVQLTVRPFFEGDSAVISRTLAAPGELTQGLCSPWQNDYRECSCYYWASARPDYVNVEPSPSGGSRGDNWLQKDRTGEYVPDDYEDARLLTYDDLFNDWEALIYFQVGGRDEKGPRPKRK